MDVGFIGLIGFTGFIGSIGFTGVRVMGIGGLGFIGFSVLFCLLPPSRTEVHFAGYMAFFGVIVKGFGFRAEVWVQVS